MTDDLISRQKAIDALMDALNDVGVLDAEDINTVFQMLPSTQPERIRGRWIEAESQCGIKCSKCGCPVDDFCYSIDYIDLDYAPNYCPNCGAKMEVNNESN